MCAHDLTKAGQRDLCITCGFVGFEPAHLLPRYHQQGISNSAATGAMGLKTTACLFLLFIFQAQAEQAAGSEG